MKKIITAMALMLMMSANVGLAFADSDEHEGYEQHESSDRGERDRGERDNEGRDRSHAAERGNNHVINQDRNHNQGGTESSGRIMPDWWPF